MGRQERGHAPFPCHARQCFKITATHSLSIICIVHSPFDQCMFFLNMKFAFVTTVNLWYELSCFLTASFMLEVLSLALLCIFFFFFFCCLPPTFFPCGGLCLITFF